METGISPMANIRTLAVYERVRHVCAADANPVRCAERIRHGSMGVSQTKQKERDGSLSLLFGAGNGNRTRTVKPHAPQTCASASSATPAGTYTIIHDIFSFVNPFFEFFLIFFKKIFEVIFSPVFSSFCLKNLAFFVFVLYNIENKNQRGALCANIRKRKF